MESFSQEKPHIIKERLLITQNIIDFKSYSDNRILVRNIYKIDKNLKELLDFISNKEKFEILSYSEHQKQICGFLGLKLETIEKKNLGDRCLIEDENLSRKINLDKNKHISKSE